MAKLKIPTRTLDDEFLLEDYQHDFNALNSELSTKMDKSDVYTKIEVNKIIKDVTTDIDNDLKSKADKSNVYTKTEVTKLIKDVTTDVEEDLTNYATKVDLSYKADKANVYTKAEVTKLLEDVTVDVEDIQNEINKVNKSIIDVNVKSFGAIGDGKANDTIAIKSAISHLKSNGGGALTFPTGKYLIDESLVIDFNNITIECNNSEFKWYNLNKETGNFATGARERYNGVFSIHGNADTSTIRQLTGVSKVKRNNKIFLRLNGDFSNGYNLNDFVRIYKAIPNALDKVYKVGFDIMCKVIEKTSEYIDVDYSSPFNFDGEDFTLYHAVKLNAVENVSISNLYINDIVPWASPSVGVDGINLTKVVCGVGILYGANITVNNLKGNNVKLPLIMEQWGYSNKFSNVFNNFPAYTGGGQGYCIQECGSLFSKIDKVGGINCRHIIDYSYSAYSELRNLYLSNSSNGDLDFHGIWEHDIQCYNINAYLVVGNGADYFPLVTKNITFYDSYFNNIYTEGFGEDITFKNCTLQLTDRTKTLDINNVNFKNCNIEIQNNTQWYIKSLYPRKTKLTFDKCNIYGSEKGKLIYTIDIDDISFKECVVGKEDSDMRLCFENVNNLEITGTLINTQVKLYGSKENGGVIKLNPFIKINENIATGYTPIISLYEVANKNYYMYLKDVDLYCTHNFPSAFYILNTEEIKATSNFNVVIKDNTFISTVQGGLQLKKTTRPNVTILSDANNLYHNVGSN